MSRWWSRLRSVLAMLGAGGWLAGWVQAGEAPRYVVRVWGTDQGLPHSSVSAICQTRDGYLWLGTGCGLVRFDGVQFTVFNQGNTPEMLSPTITCLFESADGTLWIGHDIGGVTCRKGNAFHSVPIRAAWTPGKIYGIAADPAGDIWLLNGAGDLARLRDGFVNLLVGDRVTHLLSMARPFGGGLWIHRENEISSLETHGPKLLALESLGTGRYIQGVAAGRDGGLWVMHDRELRKWLDGRWTLQAGAAPWGESPVLAALELKDGRLAAATADHGLFVGKPGGEFTQFSRTNGFPADWVTSLCEDHEGNLWAGTGNGGLAMLHPANVTTYQPPDQWHGRSVLTVDAGRDGALWIGTEGAGLYRFHHGDWTRFDTENGLNHRYVWSTVVDQQGKTWAGTWSGGLFVQDGESFACPPELRALNMPVTALLPAADGAMYVGTSVGLLRHQGGQANWLAGKADLVSPDVRALAQAPDGSIWFGMFGGGLGSYRQGQLRQYRRPDGLSSDFVQALHFDQDGGLWIGTFGGGLNYWKDGHFTVIGKKQGLPREVICHIADDELGHFWLSTFGGILRVDQDELRRCVRGELPQAHFLEHGLSDGLPTLQCSGCLQPAGCRTADGRLWFPTSRGLVAVDPFLVRTNPLPPPVVIEKFLVDDQLVLENPAPNAAVRIAPGRHRLEFQFTGLSFVAPEKVRFRYRLEGLGSDWVETDSPRRAYYTFLPPGEYRFQVRACNSDGVWSTGSAALAVTLEPAFWQTWWFSLGGGVGTALAGGLIVWWDARRRMRRKLERLRHEQAIERERARIAKDIHDDLGARLTRISLLSESVPAEEVQPPQAAKALAAIFATTHEVTEAMDEIVWAVNPHHDTLDSLATYLGKFAQDFLESAGVRCRLDMPLQLPAWRLEAEVRHNVFLAFKESLNNIVRHAATAEVHVTLTPGARAFTLVVEDFGRGFQVDDTRGNPAGLAGGNGLPNMRQRLTQIGGRCAVRSVPGQGTRIEFHVPVGFAGERI